MTLSPTEAAVVNPIDRILAETRKVIVGYDPVIEKLLYSLFSGGHTCLVSVPGLAKTMMIRAMQKAISGATSNRIQMTPDILPTGITGGEIFNVKTQEFVVRKGPVFCNLLLTDEINRAMPKAQSALLEAMAERRVTLGDQTFSLPDPFVVCATMNPIEQEGTNVLPEAQLDRFMFQIRMDYVTKQAEAAILGNNRRLRSLDPLADIEPVIAIGEVAALRDKIREEVYASSAAIEYIVSLVRATRPDSDEFKAIVSGQQKDSPVGKIMYAVDNGGSPRAEQSLLDAASVRAYHKGRSYILPEDIKYVAQEVMGHRLILTKQAKHNKSASPAQVVQMVLDKVPVVEGNVEAYRKA